MLSEVSRFFPCGTPAVGSSGGCRGASDVLNAGATVSVFGVSTASPLGTWSSPRAIESSGDRGFSTAPAISPNGTDVSVERRKGGGRRSRRPPLSL